MEMYETKHNGKLTIIRDFKEPGFKFLYAFLNDEFIIISDWYDSKEKLLENFQGDIIKIIIRKDDTNE